MLGNRNLPTDLTKAFSVYDTMFGITYSLVDMGLSTDVSFSHYGFSPKVWFEAETYDARFGFVNVDTFLST